MSYMSYMTTQNKEVVIMSNQFTGRNIITTDLPEITRSNVLNLINDTKYLHDVNSNKINYLYNYYRV